MSKITIFSVVHFVVLGIILTKFLKKKMFAKQLKNYILKINKNLKKIVDKN